MGEVGRGQQVPSTGTPGVNSTGEGAAGDTVEARNLPPSWQEAGLMADSPEEGKGQGLRLGAGVGPAGLGAQTCHPQQEGGTGLGS